MSRPLLGALCVLCLAASGSTARAANNGGASVALTWDANALRTMSVRGFPLYLTVQDAPDVRQLAIHLSWTPYAAGSDCFRVTPAGRAVACSTFTAPAAGKIMPDSAYSWTILFPSAPKSPFCLAYWVTGTSCVGGAPPNFVVTDARTRDSAGRNDTLSFTGCVALNNNASLTGATAARTAPTGSDDGSLPTQLALFTRPNPVSSEALIRFELPGSIPYELTFYDASGAIVRRANPPVSRQRGSFRWDLNAGDGRPVRPGVYFARLVTPAGTRVVPVTVIR